MGSSRASPLPVNAPAEPYTFLLNAHSRAQRRENALSMQKPVSGLLRLGTTPGMSAESEGDGTETAATAPGADAPDPASGAGAGCRGPRPGGRAGRTGPRPAAGPCPDRPVDRLLDDRRAAPGGDLRR